VARKWRVAVDDINYVFEDGDKDKGDLIRCCEKHFGFTPDFLQKERNVAFQAADLLACEREDFPKPRIECSLSMNFAIR